jgi:hypothetical protein
MGSLGPASTLGFGRRAIGRAHDLCEGTCSMSVRVASSVLGLVCLCWELPANAACTDSTVETDGVRRIALLVGVGNYLDPAPRTLLGPKNDVADVGRVISLFGFPAQNVCVLIDRDATVLRVWQELQRLARRVSAPNDQVFFFYSGHGGRVSDDDGDEVDGIDEALFLHDSMTGGVGLLRDDVLRAAFEVVRQKTPNVTAAFDSCHSGSITRGSNARGDTPRVVELPVTPRPGAGTGRDEGGWVATAPGMVVLSAATAETSAFEPGDGPDTRGYFTRALVAALSQALQARTTWAQVSRLITSHMAAEVAHQRPTFEGVRTGLVFERDAGLRPQDWEVVSVDGDVVLAGLPLPGWKTGAEASIYGPGDDPTYRAGAKAMVRITALSGLFGATARVEGPVRAALRPGDVAVMTQSSDRITPLRVVIDAPGGKWRSELEQALRDDPETAGSIQRVDDGADILLTPSARGEYELRDGRGGLRARTPTARDAADRLRSAVRQRVLASLASNSLDDLRDGEGLRIEILPTGRSLASCGRAVWPLACPGDTQEVPLCSNFQVDVVNTSKRALYVGGAILANDYQLIGLHSDDLLPPGGRVTVARRRAVTPLGDDDVVLLFGSDTPPEVSWLAIASDDRTRGPKISLAQSLKWAVPRTRAARVDAAAALPMWTVTRRAFRVVSNPRPGLAGRCAPTVADYRVTPFELRPLAGTAASRNALIRAAVDLEKEEIRPVDSARAIQALFQRTGLPYGADGAEISLAEMASENSAMTRTFSRCDTSPSAPGDVWVYLGKSQGGQSMAMAVVLADPAQQIAWGVHAWDAVAPSSVQRIAFEGLRGLDGWASAGIASMSRVACWRHRSWAGAPDVTLGAEVTGAACSACP